MTKKELYRTAMPYGFFMDAGRKVAFNREYEVLETRWNAPRRLDPMQAGDATFFYDDTSAPWLNASTARDYLCRLNVLND